MRREDLSIHEMEWQMDIEIFLDEYPCWEVEGLHCPIILQEMFLQAAHLGRKQAECMVHRGCQHSLPHLDPQVDISAIQAVGPQTTREEIRNLHYQVYKLKRLTGSPPCGPEWMEDLTAKVVSSQKDWLMQKEGQPPGDMEEPGPADAQPSRSKTPRGGGGIPLLRETLLR